MDPEAMFKISTFFLAPGTELIYSGKKEQLEEMYRIQKELMSLDVWGRSQI